MKIWYCILFLMVFLFADKLASKDILPRAIRVSDCLILANSSPETTGLN